ncbi:uncharacterized protein LOC114479060 [Gouania willdenowi]|uniref:Uncharacterized LOC114479060 n=1 Tax=Gouania willdenowi TaxID=441366 RepID=A0A8C5H6H4_GOUWI|nr:uncharacterized protein LOC114479060 [Gouania willdenowi]XP_028328302.1 uncharacterized protein LOC114479060 [Gouania willdenowi]XP_028328303.1 uncharacterized protein LOC114479060 [Gouania willdenowi]XP_028328305.1 uncharacterized protein LOC114479060 [Gouania willdenowi]
MDPGASSPIEMPALGRPFGLGMLYDCRRDIIIPGLTLWDRDDLQKNTGEITKPSSDFEIVASESIEGKSSALNVGASLTASFLGGLIQVEGSAKYLNDSKTSKNQARVTLKYKTTTKFNELSMNHLGKGNVKHPYVLDNKEATHVVTGILYGAQAFFVFDRETTANENHQDIEGILKVIIKKIPSLSIGDEGSVKLKSKEKENADKFSCKFYGDYCLNKTPTTFQDAIEVYKSLPQLLGANGENAVPVKVWLLPLTSLDSNAVKHVRQISIRLVQETQSVLEDFNELEMRYNDAVGSSTAQYFPQINKNLRSFRKMCSEFKLDLQQKLATKLPLIRGGGAEEAELADILIKRHASPFNSKSLSEWMDCKEKEICTLKSLTNKMKNTKVISSQSNPHEELFNVEHAVCFVFTSLGRDEPYLSDLSNYLKGKTKSADQDPHTRDVEQEQWFQSYKLADEMMKQVKLFSDFAEANKENKNIKFLALSLTNESKTGSSIYLYKEGLSVTEDFKPSSKPEAVTVADISHNSVMLKISPPRFGAENIISYSVEYCVSGEDDWEKSESKAEEVPVSGLRPNTEYLFRCRTVTSVGVGPANEVSARTFPCSPPVKLCVEANSHKISVSWEKPAELGQDVLILSYIVEYATSTNGEQVEDNQWKQTMATSESTILTGLQAETKYIIRVTCDCGADGRSKPSVILNTSTAKRENAHLVEYLKHCEKIGTSNLPQIFKIPLEEEDMEIDGCRKFTFGKENMRQKRTIMLLGATGSGKTTLINGMINHIVGVGWQDEFRLIIGDKLKSQAHGQTSEVTVYKINHQDGFTVPFSLTIVDTPGFGDTRGIDRDREIIEQLRTLFSSDYGVNEIDGICFVAQASLARLTATQIYVFDSVLSIFGKDVAENILIMVTFADGQCLPVLEAINESGVPCPKNKDNLPLHFRFNNSALFAHNKSAQNYDDDDENEDRGFDKMFWEMGTKSMNRFFAALNLIQTKSLKLTNEVLKGQQQLEVSVEQLQVQVRLGLEKLEELKETREKLKEHEAEIHRNKDFEFEVTVQKPYQEDISGTGNFITNCQQCQVTCHYPCNIPNDAEKSGCSAMGENGYCNQCPSKCYWNVHFNQKYRWHYNEVKEKRNVEELKKKYQKASGEKITVQGLVDKMKVEYEEVQKWVVVLMEQSAKCLNRLKEIALRPNPLSTPEYIEMLIEGEKKEGKPGWKQRVHALNSMKEKAELMAKVEKNEKLL